jgi:hypothetical protein
MLLNGLPTCRTSFKFPQCSLTLAFHCRNSNDTHSYYFPPFSLFYGALFDAMLISTGFMPPPGESPLACRSCARYRYNHLSYIPKSPQPRALGSWVPLPIGALVSILLHFRWSLNFKQGRDLIWHDINCSAIPLVPHSLEISLVIASSWSLLTITNCSMRK